MFERSYVRRDSVHAGVSAGQRRRLRALHSAVKERFHVEHHSRKAWRSGYGQERDSVDGLWARADDRYSREGRNSLRGQERYQPVERKELHAWERQN